jgi:hypothetical protein
MANPSVILLHRDINYADHKLMIRISCFIPKLISRRIRIYIIMSLIMGKQKTSRENLEKKKYRRDKYP